MQHCGVCVCADVILPAHRGRLEGILQRIVAVLFAQRPLARHLLDSLRTSHGVDEHGVVSFFATIIVDEHGVDQHKLDPDIEAPTTCQHGSG